ncbi:MAG: hypothetical protein K5707_02030, partial [Clostridia bacterium]|nr:hypothetical protein [Clostridia bacterium]
GRTAIASHRDQFFQKFGCVHFHTRFFPSYPEGLCGQTVVFLIIAFHFDTFNPNEKEDSGYPDPPRKNRRPAALAGYRSAVVFFLMGLWVPAAFSRSARSRSL